jgi:hypothetical protein
MPLPVKLYGVAVAPEKVMELNDVPTAKSQLVVTAPPLGKTRSSPPFGTMSQLPGFVQFEVAAPLQVHVAALALKCIISAPAIKTKMVVRTNDPSMCDLLWRIVEVGVGVLAVM